MCRSNPKLRLLLLQLFIVLTFILWDPSDCFCPPYSSRSLKKTWLLASEAPTYDQDASTPSISSKEGEVDDEVDENDIDALTTLTGTIVNCLVKSDLKRKGGGDGGGSTGWTSWVDDKSAFALQSCLNYVVLSKPKNPSDTSGLKKELLAKRDEAFSWTRWMKATPCPMMVELTDEVREVANGMIYDKDLQMIDSSREEFLDRFRVSLILLPSGKSLEHNIRNAPGSMCYGKLLYGGVNRYRLLPGKMKRRTGERTTLMTKENENVNAWLQYGGPDRNYDAIDMGPCAILEVIVVPQGLRMHPIVTDRDHMALSYLGWDAKRLLSFYDDTEEEQGEGDDNSDTDPLLILSGKERNDFMQDTFSQSVGGLQPQIEAIVRRVLDGRVYRSEDDNETIGSQQSFLEAQELDSLGLKAVKGVLMYGAPGCGKTLLAREIASALRAREPKIISAPELLDRWVGGSEKLIRGLFREAEEELKACRGDSTKSSLHVIVIDEIDAVFRKRSSAEDSGSTTRASAVNQILAKLDGVDAIPNVLLIGMTNRRELLDDALLRPGRLEVQIEIPRPDAEGRREIFQIHFEALRQRGRLSLPLVQVIDGPTKSIDSDRFQKPSFLSRVKSSLKSIPSNRRIRDLAADSVTGQFSGADCAGLVRCAGSIALSRARKQGEGVDMLTITLEDVIEALDEIRR